MSARAPRWVAASAAEVATRRAVMARDAGLRRIWSVTRWLAAGVVALAGALAVIASHSFHGHTVSTSTASPAASQTPAATSNGLAPAQTVPTPTPAAPVVVSGGS